VAWHMGEGENPWRSPQPPTIHSSSTLSSSNPAPHATQSRLDTQTPPDSFSGNSFAGETCTANSLRLQSLLAWQARSSLLVAHGRRLSNARGGPRRGDGRGTEHCETHRTGGTRGSSCREAENKEQPKDQLAWAGRLLSRSRPEIKEGGQEPVVRLREQDEADAARSNGRDGRPGLVRPAPHTLEEGAGRRGSLYLDRASLPPLELAVLPRFVV
jgi:hypothetical protein